MFDLHTHSVISDGKNTPEEMVEEALRRGFTRIGLSDHSHSESDDAGMAEADAEPYREEIRRLKEKYAGRIDVRLGLERDYYSDDFREYDYVIGSVHSVRMPDGYYLCVDWNSEWVERDCRKYFGGDWYALTEAYFRTEADVVRRTRCDIIGHFDLVCKNNERHRWFDENHPRYRAAWQKAADELLKTGAVFEINTGAISRGYKTEAYPSPEIRAYLRERGAKMILSSDAHQKENIGFDFDRYFGEIKTGRIGEL